MAKITKTVLQTQLRCQNDPNAILYDFSFSSKVERVIFHPLSLCFLKENHFSRGSCVGNFGTFGPKSALGSEKHVEEEIFQREGHLAISQETLCSLLFQICLLRPQSFESGH